MTTRVKVTKKKPKATNRPIKITAPLSDAGLLKLMSFVAKDKDGMLPFDGTDKADQLLKAKLERIGIKVRPTNDGDGKGCWIWEGSISIIDDIERPQPLTLDGKLVRPYRSTVATWFDRGIPSDIHVDHRCKTKGEGKALCVRPGHGHCITVNAKNAKAIERLFDSADATSDHASPQAKMPWGKPLAIAKTNNSPEITAIVKAHYAKKTRAANKAKLTAPKTKPRKANP
jgi:hypothetical protein